MAKQLLNGQKIVVVRCEALNISGEFFRAKRMLAQSLCNVCADPQDQHSWMEVAPEVERLVMEYGS